MTTVTGAAEWQELCRLVPELCVPDGYRAEVVGESVHVSPWPAAYHLTSLLSIRDQLVPYVPTGQVAEATPCAFVFPALRRCFEPDLYVADEAAFRTTAHCLPGDALSFVAELASTSTYANEWSDKAEIYGKSGIPVHLLLDMQNETTTVFWTPSPRGYVSHLTVPFGEKVHIPAPFDCELDTAAFVAPEDEDES